MSIMQRGKTDGRTDLYIKEVDRRIPFSQIELEEWEGGILFSTQEDKLTD